ncbi:sensor histidine kinase [Longispora fulva]|uniref:Two-component system sensor histidine kinase DesK n=1 Tax=Longispora fulva TaxID=619741 RepID=A0A8J7GF55_9ACTN|nr:histidine kinase [Longispora fulva]MBG6134723.1 two-component system sensor histidine kinase DesK [Longispora fulva]
MNVTAWWRSRGQAARFDLCVRASFYANLAAVLVLAAGAVRADARGAVTWVAAAAHTLICVFLVRAGIDHYLGRRARPTRLLLAGAASTVIGTAGALLWPDPPADGQAGGPLPLLVVSYVTAVATAVRPRVTLAVVLAGCAAMFGVCAAQGVPDPVTPAVGLAALVVPVALLCRVSVWMLGVMWELDRSRRAQAGLAVAEERLRFARDLHDVVGRSLSVVALKAELAAQLSRRGRAEATDEMLEVRRIAQESLAELRAVVGGYRSADLDVELDGARALLASAGIACRVDGDGAGLPPDVQGTLGWVVREATTNVLRHSEARGCTIAVRRSPADMVTFTMDNDGAGGDDRVLFGSGLTGLTERVAGLGGTVAAERRPPDRFVLAAVLPVAVGAVAQGRQP